MLRRGMKIGEAAVALDVHYRTVHRWVIWYRDGGLDEVRVHRHGGTGRRAYLSEEELNALAREIAKGCLRVNGGAIMYLEGGSTA